MKTPRFLELEGRSFGFFFLMFVLAAFIAAGLGAFYYMEHEGHWVTRMDNQIVWGTPHVFAVFLIVAASGALNVASISSVFNRIIYKPLAPLSAVLAIALLAGGLAILVLDLGRPERGMLPIPYFQVMSIFAWNMLLYGGFFAIVLFYLWTLMDPRMKKFNKSAGMAAFIWRLILTTGTGSIFGFLVARAAYDEAILGPMFVVFSFAYGMAMFIIVVLAAYSWTGRELGNSLLQKLRRMLGLFAAASLYFTVVYHLTNLYMAEHQAVERFMLLGENDVDGIYYKVFWYGQILIGGVIPLLLCYLPFLRDRMTLLIAALLVVVGGISQMYVTIIGGQAYPLEIFPGKEIVEGPFFEGVYSSYSPSLPEVLLGLSGIAVALFLVVFVANNLRLLPESLADHDIDPHHTAKASDDDSTAAAKTPA